MQKHKIGILIPAYNEDIVIMETIGALLAANCQAEHIYIVDDQSTDNTAELARFCGVNVLTVDVNGGKARAQLCALEHFQLTSRYDWVMFLDGDTKVDSNYMNVMSDAITAEPDVGLFLGQVKSVENDHIYSAARAYEYTFGQDVVKTGQDNFGVVFVAPGCASMYKSKLLDILDIDYRTLAEDMDLTMQVHRSGFKIRYIPEAIVNTQDPSNLVDYHKQVLRWSRGVWQVMLKHGVFSLGRKQAVDWYMLYTTVDTIFFNPIFWIPLLAIFHPSILPSMIALNLVVVLVIAGYSAWGSKRLDIIYKLPVYYWLSYITVYAYIRSFVEIVVLRKELLAWNKVKRYNFDSNETTTF